MVWCSTVWHGVGFWGCGVWWCLVWPVVVCHGASCSTVLCSCLLSCALLCFVCLCLCMSACVSMCLSAFVCVCMCLSVNVLHCMGRHLFLFEKEPIPCRNSADETCKAGFAGKVQGFSASCTRKSLQAARPHLGAEGGQNPADAQTATRKIRQQENFRRTSGEHH